MNWSLKKKILLMVFVFIVSVSLLCGKQVAELKEVIKPDMVLTQNGKLYVLEKTSIFIYSLKNFRLIKKFGREGEGPMEFVARPFGPPMSLSFHSGQLVVNSNNKLSYFTPEGKYIKEEKAPPNAVFFKAKQGYLGVGAAVAEDNRVYICFRLFDQDFQNPKMLYQTEVSLAQGIEFIVPMNSLHYFPIYQDKIFIVAGGKGFVIDCFDYTGKKLFSIEKKDYKKIKVTDDYKKRTREWFKIHPTFGPIFDQIKDRIIFKEYFPAIKDISIGNDRLYVITNKMQKGLWECIVMDFKGKELKRTFVPLQEAEPYTYYPLLYSIENGKFYALIENQEDETWELHMKKLQ